MAICLSYLRVDIDSSSHDTQHCFVCHGCTLRLFLESVGGVVEAWLWFVFIHSMFFNPNPDAKFVERVKVNRVRGAVATNRRTSFIQLPCNFHVYFIELAQIRDRAVFQSISSRKNDNAHAGCHHQFSFIIVVISINVPANICRLHTRQSTCCQALRDPDASGRDEARHAGAFFELWHWKSCQQKVQYSHNVTTSAEMP